MARLGKKNDKKKHKTGKEEKPKKHKKKRKTTQKETNTNMSFIEQYFEWTSKYVQQYGKMTIVLAQNGAFFEVYGMKQNGMFIGSEILSFSAICDLNIVDKKSPSGDVTVFSNKVVNAGFKTHLIDKYVQKLQEHGFTIVVVEETGETAMRTKTREVTNVYSPGTFLGNATSSNVHTNNIACIWMECKPGTMSYNRHLQMIHIGVSLVDVFTGKTVIHEQCDEYVKNPVTFDHLERMVSIYCPNEAIIVSNLPPDDVQDMIGYINLSSKSVHRVHLSSSSSSASSSSASATAGALTCAATTTFYNANVEMAKNCEKQTYQTQLLKQFYSNYTDAMQSMFYDNVYATQSFCFLLHFIHQHNPHLIYKLDEPVLEHDTHQLMLANHSLKQLNIIDDHALGNHGSCSSVLKMLNKCATAMGKRKFAQTLLHPTTRVDHLQREYDAIERLICDPLLFENMCKTLKSHLIRIFDIEKLIRLIALKRASPKMVFQLHASLDAALRVHEEVTLHEDMFLLLSHSVSSQQMQAVLSFLEETFVLSACEGLDKFSNMEQYVFNRNVDPEVDESMTALDDAYQMLTAYQSFFNKMVANGEAMEKEKKGGKKTGATGATGATTGATTGAANKRGKGKGKGKMNDVDNDIDEKEKETEKEKEKEKEKELVNIYETEKHNCSLTTTTRRSKYIVDAIHNISSPTVTLRYQSYGGAMKSFDACLDIELETACVGNKSITSRHIKEISNAIHTNKLKLIDCVERAFKQKMNYLLDTYCDQLHKTVEFITSVDVLLNKAQMSLNHHYCKPSIDAVSEVSFVDVSGLRHCLIEQIQQNELYVSNDLSLCGEGLLLYGTNAVGKTSLIRALGISIVMAQAGMFVPATRFHFAPYHHLFTRILGNDNLFKGLSTFAVEMSELRAILRLANAHSLVLGDELCSGTESISAISIFVAGVQQLSEQQCSFVFATHLHEIIGYSEITSLKNVRMGHMSVVYNPQLDCLVYNRKLEDGPGSNVYGLEVCKSLHLPPLFLEKAHAIRAKYHPETDSALSTFKPSTYNARHLAGGLCEKCGQHPAVDVHHLVFQNQANEQGMIVNAKHNLVFNKNKAANLLNLCQACHDHIHQTNKMFRKTKTTSGKTVLSEL